MADHVDYIRLKILGEKFKTNHVPDGNVFEIITQIYKNND